MSTIKVTNLRGRNGSPTLPDGAVITGVATATTFDGSLKTTGTPTLGLGVTINSSGINVSGVLTATTFKGDGSNLTGVGESIAPWHYNPDVNDSEVGNSTGIGITFNKKILAGSGTATIKIVNAGVAGTTIQSWGVSSATYNTTQFSLGALVSPLTINQTYQVDIPGPFIVDGAGTEYAGTAYTFTVQPAQYKLFSWGQGGSGQLAQSSESNISSPVQIPGNTWRNVFGGENSGGGFKVDGTLWMWGNGGNGTLAQNNRTSYSSPVQVGVGTDWTKVAGSGAGSVGAVKTDGTLWTWGANQLGELGQSNDTYMSSPVQVPGTTWPKTDVDQLGFLAEHTLIIKTNGTLWSFGKNYNGHLGHNNIVSYSSPVQIPGTTWSKVSREGVSASAAIKTDGTLWTWGNGNYGKLGHNQPANADISSPTQVPGTTWSLVSGMAGGDALLATKTNGTLWTWGKNEYGQLGLNNTTSYSSPVQVPGTTWSKVVGSHTGGLALKTDGSLWSWGRGTNGALGDNAEVSRSSPVQISSDANWTDVAGMTLGGLAIINDTTP